LLHPCLFLVLSPFLLSTLHCFQTLPPPFPSLFWYFIYFYCKSTIAICICPLFNDLYRRLQDLNYYKADDASHTSDAFPYPFMLSHHPSGPGWQYKKLGQQIGNFIIQPGALRLTTRKSFLKPSLETTKKLPSYSEQAPVVLFIVLSCLHRLLVVVHVDTSRPIRNHRRHLAGHSNLPNNELEEFSDLIVFPENANTMSFTGAFPWAGGGQQE